MFIKKFWRKANVNYSFKVSKILTTIRSSPDTKPGNVKVEPAHRFIAA